MPHISVGAKGIILQLQRLNPHQVCSRPTDETTPYGLQGMAHSLAEPLATLLQASPSTAIVPDNWKTAIVVSNFPKKASSSQQLLPAKSWSMWSLASLYAMEKTLDCSPSCSMEFYVQSQCVRTTVSSESRIWFQWDMLTQTQEGETKQGSAWCTQSVSARHITYRQQYLHIERSSSSGMGKTEREKAE